MSIRKRIIHTHQALLKRMCASNMKGLRNSQKGRCFVVGNGPSLTVSDLELLKNEVTFAANRIYGVYPRTDWRPTYYVSQDFDVLAEIKDNLYDVSHQCDLMILAGNLYRHYDRQLKKKKNVKYLYINNIEIGKTQFDIDVCDGIHNSISVTYTSIELAIYMGYTEIYLIGVDHNYGTKLNANGEIIIDNHSKESYPDFIPPLKLEGKASLKADGTINNDNTTNAFVNARKYADANGIHIYNATRGGRLEVFERVNLEDVLEATK